MKSSISTQHNFIRDSFSSSDIVQEHYAILFYVRDLRRKLLQNALILRENLLKDNSENNKFSISSCSEYYIYITFFVHPWFN